LFWLSFRVALEIGNRLLLVFIYFLMTFMSLIVLEAEPSVTPPAASAEPVRVESPKLEDPGEKLEQARR
jgi:hypothetical protein